MNVKLKNKLKIMNLNDEQPKNKTALSVFIPIYILFFRINKGFLHGFKKSQKLNTKLYDKNKSIGNYKIFNNDSLERNQLFPKTNKHKRQRNLDSFQEKLLQNKANFYKSQMNRNFAIKLPNAPNMYSSVEHKSNVIL